MLLPPSTDLLALLGIDLVLCAGLLALLARWPGLTRQSRLWMVPVFFAVMWVPAGTAFLPILSFVRGSSSDLSVTLVVLACLRMGQGLFGLPAVAQRERLVLHGVIAMFAVMLYPTALGWGDWDAYSLGWGSMGMLAILLLLSLACWIAGLRLLPALVGLALLAWVGGLMESSNLWDYLLDPWLAIMACIGSVKAGVSAWLGRQRRLGAKGSLHSP